MKNEKPPKRGHLKAAMFTCLAVAVLLIVVMLVWFISNKRAAEYQRYEFDTDAMAGRIQHMTDEQIQAELDRVVEEGMFNICISSGIAIDKKTMTGAANIENIAANRYNMQVDIVLKDTGDTVYSSKLIKPGYSIENITLSKKLSPGEYDATAIFSAITQNVMQLFGTAAAEIKIYVVG